MGCDCCKDVNPADYEKCQKDMVRILMNRGPKSFRQYNAPCGESFTFGAKYTMPKKRRNVKIGDKAMSKEEYQKKIDELNEQIVSLNTQIVQVNKEFRDSLLRELEEQGITSGTKVSVKTKTWRGDEIDIETYFFGLSLKWGEWRHIFHKVKKDGTMSQINQYIEGRIISIHKI